MPPPTARLYRDKLDIKARFPGRARDDRTLKPVRARDVVSNDGPSSFMVVEIEQVTR